MFNQKQLAAVAQNDWVSTYQADIGQENHNYQNYVIPTLMYAELSNDQLQTWHSFLMTRIKQYQLEFKIRYIFERELLPNLLKKSAYNFTHFEDLFQKVLIYRHALQKVFPYTGNFFNHEKLIVTLFQHNSDSFSIELEFENLKTLLRTAKEFLLKGPLESRIFNFFVYLSVKLKKTATAFEWLKSIPLKSDLSLLLPKTSAWELNHIGNFTAIKDNCPYAESTLVEAIEKDEFLIINDSFLQKFVNAHTALYLGPPRDGFNFGHWYETQNTRHLKNFAGGSLKEKMDWKKKRASYYSREELYLVILVLGLKEFFKLAPATLHIPAQNQHKASDFSLPVEPS